MMSLRSNLGVLRRFVEVVASSGTVELNLRRFEGVAVKWKRIERSKSAGVNGSKFRRMGCQFR